MPSQVTKTLLVGERAFSFNFKIEDYDKKLTAAPILNIWKDIQVSIRQEEKKNSYLYLYHEIKRSETLETISDQYYRTPNFWWLILITNEISDPFDFVTDMLNVGNSIKILKSDFLGSILQQNKSDDITKYLMGDTYGKTR